MEAKKVLGKSVLGTEIGRKWLWCRKTCRKSELLRPHKLMWLVVFSVCLDVSVFNMADTELYSSHSESPAETGQHAHSLTKNSLRLQWCAAPFLYSCFPCSEERLLVGGCVFFCFSVHHGGGCSYMGVYDELQHYKQGRNITWYAQIFPVLVNVNLWHESLRNKCLHVHKIMKIMNWKCAKIQ